MAKTKKKAKKGKTKKKIIVEERIEEVELVPPCPLDDTPLPPEVDQNSYPGILETPARIAFVRCNGDFETLCDLINQGLTCADRVFIIVPWGHYVLMYRNTREGFIYFLYNGCTCNVNLFRYLDLQKGAAGFVVSKRATDLVEFIMQNRETKMELKLKPRKVPEEYFKQYCACRPNDCDCWI